MKKSQKMLLCLAMLLVLLPTLCGFAGAEERLPWPISTAYGITTPYHYWDGSAHNGVDMTAPIGTPVYAQFDGTAEYYQVYTVIDGENYLTSYGSFVYLTSTDGTYWAAYAHLDAFEGCELVLPSTQTRQRSGHDVKLKLCVRCVETGDLLGYVGTSGNSNGPHLHYGLKINGDYVDPTGLLDSGLCAAQCKSLDRQAELGRDFFAFLLAGNTEQALTLEDNGLTVQPHAGLDRQIWHFTKQPDGSYEIVNCAVDQHLRIWEDGTVGVGGDPQGWRAYGDANGFRLMADGTDDLLTMEAGTTRLQPYSGAWSQYFRIRKLPFADAPVLRQRGTAS